MRNSTSKAFFIVLVILDLFSLQVQAQCSSCTFTDNGSSNTYNLNSGQTLCISSGTFTGTINNFPAGSVICVAQGATFRPGNFNNISGTLYVYGTATFTNSISLNSGFVLDITGTVNFNSNPNTNGAISIINHSAGTLNFSNAFTLGNNSSFTNYGSLNAASDFSTNSGTSFTNRGRGYTNGNFNPAGAYDNYNYFRAKGFININSSAVVRNYCSLVSDKGFNNNSNSTQNYGFIVVNATASYPDDLWQNNASFYNGPAAMVQTVRFINNATITGSGTIRASGETRNQGPFGNDGLGINFYDATPTGVQYFDFQNTNPHATVSKTAVAAKDSNYVAANCNLTAAAALPVRIEKFTLAAQTQTAVLSWVLAKESGLQQLELQSSKDGQHFTTILMQWGNETGNNKELSYTDKVQEATQAYYYRLKITEAGGAIAYSQVLVWKQTMAATMEVQVFPNPAAERLQVNFKVTKSSSVIVKLTDMNGAIRVQKTVVAVSGVNSIVFAEVASFSKGMYAVVITDNNGQVNEVRKFLKN